jgi:bacteriophage exclusion system BrxA-like protein
MVINKKYSFSFTGASALIPETLTTSEIYRALQDMELTKQKIITGNLLHRTKAGTFQREFQELSKRILSLTKKQLNVLCDGDREEAKAMILLSILKTYPFIYDFIVEVVRNKTLMFENTISDVDYNRFIESKSMTHPELETISQTTKDKIKQRTFTFLEQVGLINNLKEKRIIRPVLSHNCYRAIIADDESYLTGFLLSAAEIKSAKTNSKNDSSQARHPQDVR